MSVTSFNEIQPEIFELLFTKTNHLHWIRAELRSQIARLLTVWDQLEVLPEQMLDKVVRVNEECQRLGDSLGCIIRGQLAR